MARIFAYIEHKSGVADDSSAEFVAAAKKIDPAASPTAVAVSYTHLTLPTNREV